MDQVNLGYSTKNIPIPDKKEYLKRMISSAERLIRRIRWRTFFFLNKDATTEKKTTYGFCSSRAPPYIMDLKQFEDDMLNLVQNIEFSHKSNTFQEQLNKDKKITKEGDKLLVSADKTTHFYKVDPDNYDRLLNTNITKDYKKAATTLENTIRKGDKKIATELGLDDRINKTSKNQAFITLKDHKPNFNNNPTCRLINPTKSEIGKISKQILEKVNNAIRNATRLNQWENKTQKK
jgi:hypothetical protein